MPVLATTLLVFPLGAASSRSACAAVLRPEPLCLPACYRGHLVEQPFLRSVRRSVLGFRMAGIMLAVLAKPLFFFAGRRFFALSFCAAVLRPASLCLLTCFVFSFERSQCWCLPCCSCVSAREWLYSCLFVKLLCFRCVPPLGATSSCSACAVVPLPAPSFLSTFYVSSGTDVPTSQHSCRAPCLCALFVRRPSRMRHCLSHRPGFLALWFCCRPSPCCLHFRLLLRLLRFLASLFSSVLPLLPRPVFFPLSALRVAVVSFPCLLFPALICLLPLLRLGCIN